MARKIRVSFIRGVMVVAAIYGAMPVFSQTAFAFVGSGFSKIKTMKAKHSPRIDSHKTAKKAITRGFVLNTARTRKKKRRDVNARAAQSKVTTIFVRMTHIEYESIAEENHRLIMKQQWKIRAHIGLILSQQL